MVIWCLAVCGLSAQPAVVIEKLPAAINSPDFDESSPVVSHDGRTLFFTRTGFPEFDRTLVDESGQAAATEDEDAFRARLAGVYGQLAGRPVADPYRSSFNQDIWYCTLDGDRVSAPRHPGYPLNSALPNSLLGCAPRPDEYIVLNQFYEDGSMLHGFSRVEIRGGLAGSLPSPVHIYGFGVTHADVNMTMTSDGDAIVLSMQGPDARGANDLYVSFYIRDNVWSAPRNIGDAINTPYQETSPFMSPDKRFMYFASNRPGGRGGHDIYVSERLDYTWMHWSAPVLLEGDVNSPEDESQPFFDPQRRFMFFVSRRDGSSDIFRQVLEPQPGLKKPIHVRGRIVSATDGKPVHGELYWGTEDAAGYLEYFNSYTGEFEVTLTERETYRFESRKVNHRGQQLLIDAAMLDSLGTDTVDLVIYVEPGKPPRAVPMPVTRAITADDPPELTDIRFVRSQAVILESSAGALEDLLARMRANPQMEIRVEGHTDNVGDEGALVDLSVSRADAVKAYLVRHGIDGMRIRTRGYGATKPRYDNATETGRAGNRRVEIRIIRR
jgi:outer membrane protein OmpA-like peptidoglycan-associated protein